MLKTMPKFTKHIFICVNQREAGYPPAAAIPLVSANSSASSR